MVVVPDCAEPLEAIISNLIEYMLFADALVLAESYHARANTEESLHMLVKCLMLLRRYKAVHAMLKKEELPSARIRYFYAKSCFEIGEYQDAEHALREPRVGSERVELHRSFQQSAASPLAHLLLAQIIVETGSEDQFEASGGNEFRLSVKENPFIFSAVKGFCEVNYGSREDVAKILVDQFREVKQQFVQQQENPKRTRSRKASAERPLSQASSTRSTRSTSKSTPLNQRSSARQAENVAKKASVNAALAAAPRRTSSRTIQSRDDSKKRTRGSASAATLRTGLRSENASVRGRESNDVLQMNAMNTLRSRRVLNTSGTPSVLKSNSRKLGTNKKAAPLAALNRQQPEEHHVSQVAITMPIVIDPSTSFGTRPNDENQLMLDDDYGMKPVAEYVDDPSVSDKACNDTYPIFGDVVDYLTRLAVCQRFLSRYESGKAKKALELGFPPCFQNTALVLEMRARATFELGEYKEVVAIMHNYRERYPFLPNGLEILSTALWHLQDAHGLSALAKSVMTDLDDTAEAWCVNGNCFSVQKKHDTAIECLSRAVSINPRFAYAYTLLGHELVDVEQSDKAIEAFSMALQYCPNEYRAYYGLALVHFKREEMEDARTMLTEAISINRHSTVLLCQLAKVEQHIGNKEKADEILRKALKMSPDSVAVRYHYADNLVAMKRNAEALEVLKVLKQLSPDEPNIYNLMGRVYRKVNNEHLGQLNVNWARDMDPRQGQPHSVLSERRYEEDETPQRTLTQNPTPGQSTPRYPPVDIEEDEQMDDDDAASSISDSAMNDSPFSG